MHETQRITKWRRGEGAVEVDDALAVEEPLEIRVRGKAVSVTMRTPGNGDEEDAELAAGFLFTEGMIAGRADIARIDPCVRTPDGNVINVFLRPDAPFDFDHLTRHVFMSSSCGVCGKACIESIHGRFDPVPADDGPRVTGDTLLALPRTLRDAQGTFERTGGLHAAALFDAAGTLVAVREDVGRHNAVDKVVGHALLGGRLPLSDHVLLVSGRTSFEILQKALAARVAVVAAISAPSSLAADFAHDSGQTLVGFLRDERMNVYSHPQRVTFG